jgi:hypothetical protein
MLVDKDFAVLVPRYIQKDSSPLASLEIIEHCLHFALTNLTTLNLLPQVLTFSHCVGMS